MFPRLWASDHRPRELVIFVANVGLRPVTLTEALLEVERGEGGYLPFLDSELRLPVRLEEREATRASKRKRAAPGSVASCGHGFLVLNQHEAVEGEDTLAVGA
jgi:hypothetical protein